VAIDASMIAGEQVQGLTNQVIKLAMFNCSSCRPEPATAAVAAAATAAAPMES